MFSNELLFTACFWTTLDAFRPFLPASRAARAVDLVMDNASMTTKGPVKQDTINVGRS